MARLNIPQSRSQMRRHNLSGMPQTHEGAPAVPIPLELQLRRSVMACLLWEKTFYEDGQEIADRIVEVARQLNPAYVADVAIEARTHFNLRHAPLLLLEVISKTGPDVVAQATPQIIQRVDEFGETLAILWRNGRKMIPHQLRKGMRWALQNFDEYQLAKYDRDGPIKLRDVFRLVRPKPTTEAEGALWQRAVKRQLATPDTWEVELSAGKDKKETFERLIREKKLGYLALLRNLRNMAQAGVDEGLVKEAIVARKGGAHRVLPFRYVAAARAAPQYEPWIDQALCEAIGEQPIMSGKTIVLVDISGSMDGPLSGRSDMHRVDAAAALASMIHGDVRVFSFTDDIREVPPRRGMAGVDAIIKSQSHGGTMLGHSVRHLINNVPGDRIIVLTDEQAHDVVPDPVWKHNYMINVGSYQNGVGYGKWTHIDGFSEAVLRYIHEFEQFEPKLLQYDPK